MAWAKSIFFTVDRTPGQTLNLHDAVFNEHPGNVVGSLYQVLDVGAHAVDAVWTGVNGTQ